MANAFQLIDSGHVAPEDRPEHHTALDTMLHRRRVLNELLDSDLVRGLVFEQRKGVEKERRRLVAEIEPLAAQHSPRIKAAESALAKKIEAREACELKLKSARADEQAARATNAAAMNDLDMAIHARRWRLGQLADPRIFMALTWLGQLDELVRDRVTVWIEAVEPVKPESLAQRAGRAIGWRGEQIGGNLETITKAREDLAALRDALQAMIYGPCPESPDDLLHELRRIEGEALKIAAPFQLPETPKLLLPRLPTTEALPATLQGAA